MLSKAKSRLPRFSRGLITSGKKILLIFNFSFLSFNFSFAQAPSWLWAKLIGGFGGDITYSSILDASSNIYLTGVFGGTADFDPGPGVFNLTSVGGNDVFVCKLDASGNFVWAKQMVGPGFSNYGYAITLDASGNIYVTGTFADTADFDPGPGVYNLISYGGSADIFTVKLDNGGNFIWAAGMGGPAIASDEGQAICVDNATGDVYTAGFFQGPTDFDPGPGTFLLNGIGGFICKLDVSGNFVWAKATGGAANSIARDNSGNIYISGFFGGTLDFDPGPGIFNLTSVGSSYEDCFISKLDGAGNFIWAKAMGGPQEDRSYSMALTLAKDFIYTTGYFKDTADFDPGPGVFNLITAGNTDIFLSKLDSAGNFIWAKSMGGTDYQLGRAVAVDALDKVYITCDYGGAVDFDPGPGLFNLTSVGGTWDFCVVKIDSAGNFVWAKTVGGTNNDYGTSIMLDASGYARLAGYFQSPSISFGITVLTNSNAGNAEIFVSKLDTLIIPTHSNEPENSQNTVQVLPNPFTFQTTLIFSNKVHNATFSLYNLLGEKAAELANINGVSFQFNRGQLPSGVYIFEVKEKEKKIARGKAVVY